MLQPDPHDVLASLVYMAAVAVVLWAEWRIAASLRRQNDEAPAPKGGQK